MFRLVYEVQLCTKHCFTRTGSFIPFVFGPVAARDEVQLAQLKSQSLYQSLARYFPMVDKLHLDLDLIFIGKSFNLT